MAKREGPEWFKFWRRNRLQLDIEHLNMEDRGIVFTNMMRYFDSGDKELLDMTPIQCMAFNVVKINVDDSFTEFMEIAERNRENGQKGGRPKKNPENPVGFSETQKTQTNPKKQKTEDRSQKSEERSQKKEVGTADKPPRFSPPSVDEITAYCQERKNTVDPLAFADFYASKGWRVGREPMKDWKAAVRTWERRQQHIGRDHGDGDQDQEIAGVLRL